MDQGVNFAVGGGNPALQKRPLVIRLRRRHPFVQVEHLVNQCDHLVVAGFVFYFGEINQTEHALFHGKNAGIATWNYLSKTDADKRAVRNYLIAHHASDETPAICFLLTPLAHNGGAVLDNMTTTDERYFLNKSKRKNARAAPVMIPQIQFEIMASCSNFRTVAVMV